MRQNVEFMSEGLTCRGWLYTPDELRPGQKAPGVVMAHGLSCVKEMGLPFFAEHFAGAGLVTLVFDLRFLGESEGEPRGQLFPMEQQADYRNAITWLSGQPHVDPERIGIWGSSLSGGIVLYVATYDKRVKAVVAQVPSATDCEDRRSVDPERFDRVGEMLLQDRISRYWTGAVKRMNVVAPAGEPSAMPHPVAYDWIMRWAPVTPTWCSTVTLESIEKIREFDPVSKIHLISPAALLMVAAQHDELIPLRLVESAFARAGEPKSLVVLPCGHFEVYDGTWGERAAGVEVEWFRKHLLR